MRRVRRDSRIASGTASRSPRTRVRSDASIAASVPVPMARPRSAWASAAASLTPSPTPAPPHPPPPAALLQPLDPRPLAGRQHAGDPLADAHRLGHGPAGALVVPG